MRMDATAALSAYEVVNEYSKEKLEYILDTYGEIKPYKKLASAIIEARSKTPITSAQALSQIAINVLGSHGKIHPATLMFPTWTKGCWMRSRQNIMKERSSL